MNEWNAKILGFGIFGFYGFFRNFTRCGHPVFWRFQGDRNWTLGSFGLICTFYLFQHIYYEGFAGVFFKPISLLMQLKTGI